MGKVKDSLEIPQIIKNEHYTNMLSYLDSSMQNWKNFSRLDRLEYAYQCLELARNYTCATRGVDPSSIKASLEILDHAGQTHSAKYPNESIQSVVTLSVEYVLNAFKSKPTQILACALHECTHACDSVFKDRPYLENLPNMGQRKVGDKIYPQEMYRELSKSYDEFGIAWLGSRDEIRANEVGFGVTTSLLQDLAKLHSDNPMYQVRYSAYATRTSTDLQNQHDAETHLEQWKTELLAKYTPEGQTDYPTVTEDMISTDFSIPKHSFVDIDTIRRVAEERPEVFKSEGYVDTELIGATNKQEVDSQEAEIVNSFNQNNNFCIQKISQVVTPQETTDFFPAVETMELN